MNEVSAPVTTFMPKRSVCLVSGGIIATQLRLQPWRYLHETARQLGAQGHAVTIISDGATTPQKDVLEGVAMQRIPTITATRTHPNDDLHRVLAEHTPDVVLWHVGATSFLPQRVIGAAVPTVGIFTSPMYEVRELARLGVRRLIKGYKLSAMHVAGASLPGDMLGRGVEASGLQRVVVQTHATRRQLVAHGVQEAAIEVIAPGVDAAWERPGFVPHDLREQLGFAPDDAVVVYFGSPAPLRGLHTLIEAVGLARHHEPRLKLLVLSRRRADELMREDVDLARLLSRDDAHAWVTLVSGFLPEDELVRHVAAADIAALPFEIIPSDAPLSILEAQALGKPIVVTTVGCLAELAAHGPTYLAQPADPVSLAGALVRAVRDGVPHSPSRPIPNRSWREVGAEWSRLVEQL
jgi:glycosyltransferase involved in cell wall biosynthesis